MKYILTLSMVVLLCGHLRAEDITSRDFAAGYYLELDNNGAVYSLALPADVYRTVKRADLGDIRVFNGAGEPVPHGFRTVGPEKRALRSKEGIPFFPLFQAGQQDNGAGLSLQVTRNSTGTIVNIESGPDVESLNQEITGYLLDLSSLERGARELDFQWQKDIDSSLFTINIQQSSDLVRWTPLVHKATLADLQYGGQRVERRTVFLPRKVLNYLKLTWHRADPPLRLTTVTGFSKIIESRQKRQWVQLYNGNVLDKKGQLLIDYNTNYRLPTNSVQIGFPETNSIAKLSVQSRLDEDAGWRTRCEQLFYNLSLETVSLKNEPCTFQPTADSMWRLVVKEDGAGLRSGHKTLSLQLGWMPNELLFIGRGTPPFLLAFGSGKLEQQKKTDSEMVLQAITTESPQQVISRARLGKRVSLGGDAALQPPPERPPWKKWLLWMVLLLGVGFLALMVRSLVKEMKTAEEKKVSKER